MAGQKSGKKTWSKVSVWILVGMLCFGLLGVGATSLSGTVRSIGSVGNKAISTQAYYSALNQELNVLQQQLGSRVSFAQAQSLGADTRALQRLVSARLLDNEAARQGISIGNEAVHAQRLQIPAFRGSDGEFDPETYRRVLSNSGQSVREFEDSLRDEAASRLIQAAVLSGFEMPEIYRDTLLQYVGQRRDFQWARLTPDTLVVPVTAPTDAQLRLFYEDNPALFSLPERKRIQYAWLTPEILADRTEISEERLRQEYDARYNQFNQPERRLIERLVIAAPAEAETYAARVSSGEATFEQIAAERGLALGDIDLGDVARDELDPAIAPALFAAASGSVIGPLQSPLGPALYRINGVIEPLSVPFEEAREILRDGLVDETARRQIAARTEDIENLLAEGATVQDLDDLDMQVSEIDWHSGVEDGIAAYHTFQTVAGVLQEEDFPELVELDNGAGIFVAELLEVLPARLEEFENVRDTATEEWTKAETLARLNTLAETLIPRVGQGVDMAVLGLSPTQESGITRLDVIPDGSPELLERVFALEIGEVAILEGDASIVLVRLDGISPPDLEDQRIAVLSEGLANDLNSSLASDGFELFLRTMQENTDLSFNQTAIEGVHAQLQ